MDVDHICAIIMGDKSEHGAVLKQQIGQQTYHLVSLCQLASCKLTYGEMLVFLINLKRVLHPEQFYKYCTPMLLNLEGIGKIYNSVAKEGYLANGNLIWRVLEWERVREPGSIYPELLHPLTPFAWRNQSSNHRSCGTLLRVERSTDFLTPVVPRMTLKRARCFTGTNSLIFIPWKLGQITFNILGIFLDVNQLRQCLNIETTYELIVLR